MTRKNAQRKPLDVKPAPLMFAIGSPVWPGLSKVAEEAGEAVQVIGKLMGNGGELEHWDGTNLRARLCDELGDLLAACRFAAQENGLEQAVELRAASKLETFRKWHTEARTQTPAKKRKR